MTTLRDLQDVRIIDDGLTPVGFPGQVGPAAEDVDFGDDERGGDQRFGAGDDFREQRLEKFGLAGQRLFVGAEHLTFLGPEFLGGETLGVHHGLLADIVGRDGGQVGLGDLDGVTERAVIPDLERFDARAVLLVALEFGDPALAVRSERAESVQLSVETCAQGAAFGQVRRKFIAKGGFQTSQQRRLGLDTGGQRGQRAARQGLQLFAQGRQGTQRVADAAELARIPQTIL